MANLVDYHLRLIMYGNDNTFGWQIDFNMFDFLWTIVLDITD